MKSRDIIAIGIPKHLVKIAQRTLAAAQQSGMKKRAMPDFLAAVWSNPEANVTDPIAAELATSLVDYKASAKNFEARESPAPYRQWGTDLEPQSVQQMVHACELPIAVRGALMPDAHLGYGLPIGGVLGTKGAVIPYAVGVDIACRVKLSVLDLPVERLKNDAEGLTKALIDETRFGIGAHFSTRRQHDVMDRDWSVTPTTLRLKDKAWSQLGSSGGGNHFVEFGIFEVDHDSLGLPAGKYLALLSHSGSRGTGAAVCQEYSKRAMATHPGLPKELKHLAWLDLDDEDGQEYWATMSLMGEYAAGNHACIHRHIVEHLAAEVLLDVENHHNFAWKEMHNGEELVVHRKGATPAGKGVLGIIPGSMATPAYVVRGLGQPESLDSAAHGAGRVMSRKKAYKTLRWDDAKAFLKERDVTLLSAGLDEVPAVYKDIHSVMAAQADLVEPLAQFKPKLVRMADGGPAED
jgi:tRNA-splicing ligase RtcB